ncbi:glutathione S-transferase [Bradyrhizobium sp. NAS80.1]|uniref:glutathione S-transferase n=1 Tax=Bradyrhizobium sp. NAS80.1 TaxID=1680159 RepID=UPI00096881A1|nr:glutathione S-transferase [Bradyrhizobium sp. NAS80.1]OKO85494.1 glutathione S-transferase [Bradyrhizobium sp. NAS80.1]
MKIYYSPFSPYVRKVLVAAHELGLAGRIEQLPSAAHPINRDQTIIAHNPLGQVPTMLLDDGTALADSRVICEYLDDLTGGKLFPKSQTQRWRALTDQSIADGILTAALLSRYELVVRPPEKLWQPWLDGQLDKVETSIAAIEKTAPMLGDRVDIGTISFACAFGYLDLRFPDFGWRSRHPQSAAWFASFETRPSMQATRHPAG